MTPEQRVKEQLDAEAEAAERLDVEKSRLDLETELTELAKLSPVEYDQVREKKAKELGIRVGTLDSEVEKKRGESGGSSKPSQGRSIKLYEPEPWHTPVDGAQVLSDAADVIMQHMVMRQEDADACALWCAHTYIYEVFDHTPRLMITAPAADCGKTALMSHMVGNMINKPEPVELMKPAPFFRLAEAYAPTFLIDEVDQFIKEDSELLAALNNGWEPHGGVPRCVGDDNEVRIFSTHCPVAMAGINLYKKLPATTISRSIVINLERAAVGEIDDDNIYDSKRHRKALRTIGKKLARWCQDNKDRVKHQSPNLPKSVRNRLANKWGPLFSIAHVAGGNWPGRVKAALFAQMDMKEPSKGELLLSDMQRVVTTERISTVELITRLCGLDGTPWANYNFREREDDRRKITDQQLSSLLKPYKVTPTQLKIDGVKLRGYRRSPMENAWERYLTPSSPATPPQKGGTPVPPSHSKGFSQSNPGTPSEKVPGQPPPKPSQGAGGTGVPDKKGGQAGGIPDSDYPDGLIEVAENACSDLKLTADEFIAELEPEDYPEIISDPVVAKVTAKSMNARR